WHCCCADPGGVSIPPQSNYYRGPPHTKQTWRDAYAAWKGVWHGKPFFDSIHHYHDPPTHESNGRECKCLDCLWRYERLGSCLCIAGNYCQFLWRYHDQYHPAFCAE